VGDILSLNQPALFANQHAQRVPDLRSAQGIVDAVIVNKQALGQVGIGIALDLDVDQQPVFLPVGVDHAHQPVRQAPAKLASRTTSWSWWMRYA
jgi:hypothetical protein